MSAGRPELAHLDHLLRGAAAGRPAVLRIIGERGIGKTTILDYAASVAVGLRVLRVRAVASERELPYAGLHLLCAPLLEEIHALPTAHRDAFTAALGLSDGQRPDRFLLSLATLNLVAGIAAAQPVCVVIDDAHCLDNASAQILAFLARRVDQYPVLLLIAEHDEQRLAELDGLPEMHLQPLSPVDARAMLAATVPGRIDDRVVERILAETRGNPRVLLDAFDGVTAAEFAGGFAIPRRLPCMTGDDCLERVKQLAPGPRRLLLTAAADPTGDPALLWRAAARLQFSAKTTELLEAHDLLVVGSRVAFACPRLRPAVYFSAAPGERRLVHQALAEVTDADPVRRSWHLAAATSSIDDALADDLERDARRAQSRGGTAARAAFLEKAALLTEDPARRADRALAAAAAKHLAGAPEAVQRLLAIAKTGPYDPARAARTAWHEARVETTVRGDGAARSLFEGARRLEPYDAAAAREAYLEALLAAMSAGHPTSRAAAGIVVDIARSALASAITHRSHPVDQLLYGLATRTLDGYSASVSPLSTAVISFRGGQLDSRAGRWLGLAGSVAADLWDDRACTALADRRLHLAADVDSGAPVEDAGYQALAELQRGRLASASTSLTTAVAGRAFTVSARLKSLALLLAAWQGQRLTPDHRLPAASNDAGAVTGALSAAVLLNSLGRYDEAADAAEDAARCEHLGLTGWALMELVEAAARSGRLEKADEAAVRLADRAGATGTDWALGCQATAQALLADREAAEPLYREAVDRLARTETQPWLARAQLLYGEWLRRRSRRVDARTQLHAAHEIFATIGAVTFADRAHRELVATGESARKRTLGGKLQLTPQESRVAYLARDGLSNPEIGAQLFVSPRTVEYHLHKVFAKLAISSRTELHLVLDWPTRDTPAHVSVKRSNRAGDTDGSAA